MLSFDALYLVWNCLLPDASWTDVIELSNTSKVNKNPLGEANVDQQHIEQKTLAVRPIESTALKKEKKKDFFLHFLNRFISKFANRLIKMLHNQNCFPYIHDLIFKENLWNASKSTNIVKKAFCYVIICKPHLNVFARQFELLSVRVKSWWMFRPGIMTLFLMLPTLQVCQMVC